MRPAAVERGLTDFDYLPLTSALAGRFIFDMVLASGVEDILELGFAHGTSTAYIAAALDEKGAGKVTTIDRQSARSRQPNIHEVLAHLGLEDRVQPIFAERSYIWELMKLVERQSRGDRAEPCFDFCFFDGAHTWETDGFAFFLVDKLLRDDRWLLFDDLRWTYASSPLADAHGLPPEESETQQVLKVYDLLVRQHPSYTNFRVLGGYGWAYKAAPEGERSHDADFDRLIDSELMSQIAFPQLRAG